MPTAEILTIGTEILLGQIVDTNAAYLADQLATIGLHLYRKSSVGDNEKRIRAALLEALSRSDVVITTGGLGPTVDDMTRSAVAAATDCQLETREDLVQEIQRFFDRRGRPMAPNNRRQAQIPTGAIAIHNPVGTAPGFIVQVEGKWVISLPGVPRELEHLMRTEVLPFLRARFPKASLLRTRLLRVAAMSESEIDRKISDLEESSNPTVGLAAHAGVVDIRITASAVSQTACQAMLDKMATKVRERLPNRVFGEDRMTLATAVARAIEGKTLALLETNTGGLIAAQLLAAGALHEGQVLPCHRIELTGSREQTAVSMADQLRRQTGAQLGLAILGQDDPEMGPHCEKTGETALAVSDGNNTKSRLVPLGGTSDLARSWLAAGGLELLRRFSM